MLLFQINNTHQAVKKSDHTNFSCNCFHVSIFLYGKALGKKAHTMEIEPYIHVLMYYTNPEK